MSLINRSTQNKGMEFEPVYYGDRLHMVNPNGHIGVVTLWTPLKRALFRLNEVNPDWLDPKKSSIAAIGNLYGEGLAHLLCNLYWNPQIRSIIALGQDLTQAGDDLLAVANGEIEEHSLLGAPVWRIKPTHHVLNYAVDPFPLKNRLEVLRLGGLKEEETWTRLQAFMEAAAAAPYLNGERVQVRLPEPSVDFLPSDVRDHTVRRSTPLECWQELVFRVRRFGRPVRLRKGRRIELQNAKVIVLDPQEEPDDRLDRFGFSRTEFDRYQKWILERTKRDDISYTYGHRLRGYFQRHGQPVDGLDQVVGRLADDPESRKAFVTTWDNTSDLVLDEPPPATDDDEEASVDRGGSDSVPCLVTLFYRVFDGRLTLTATYRSHNLMSAWLKNVYGLIALQRYVADRIGVERGPLTVISHSLTIDPDGQGGRALEMASDMADARTTDDEVDPNTGKVRLREDPNGYFVVTIDKELQEIIVDHKFESLTLKRYTGKDPQSLESQIARDMSVSLISHALYLGREIALRHVELKALARNKGADAEARTASPKPSEQDPKG